MRASSGSSIKGSVGFRSDAGYPESSDADYRVIAIALEEGFRMEVIAGAVPLSLLSSPQGFPPRAKPSRVSRRGSPG